jgi:hypothetical protein
MRPFTIVLALLLAACGPGEEAAPPAAAAPDSAAQDPMSGMAASPTGRMIEDMRAAIARINASPAESLAVHLPDHRRNTANLLAEMNREMESMQMGSDATWSATVDSVRQDLVRLAEADGEQVRALLPDHTRRVERLMASHEQMMKH